ncbi:FAD-binding oxidoreductase [Acuticoccus sp. MNP-M23]|uniref:FAD-binding oxidoreductase n=1 Tax=Acuticoccus sp. MNP-M23 TaxID=3072793 RepID=UPI002816737C|nr:FAD-binding oxidoreductase [Acuticoccus sp. MNP-M23]WMS42280.1 FAD-binding oxidoreductase [Acuticoccus sp. MNP-M23]
MTHTLTLQSRENLTHDVVHLTFDRPAGYDFTPGQANHWDLPVDGMRDAGKPFTITSLPDENHLQFVIKTYRVAENPDHDGGSEHIGTMEPGATVEVDDPSGDISDKGAGVFIAGGAGITPFIPILRARAANNTLEGCTLVYSNKTERDIILREEWEGMTGLQTIFTVTDHEGSPLPKGQIDAEFLKRTLGNLDHRFYVCGPPSMMKAVIADLRDNGVPDDRIVVETKWLE